MVRSRDWESTDDPETTGGVFGSDETEIFFGPRTGRFSALDDSRARRLTQNRAQPAHIP